MQNVQQTPTQAVEQTRPRAVKASAPTRIAIASGKGGVGKTWFAISLASALSERGEKVLLVDGDLGLANVDVQLGLSSDRDLAAVLSGKLSLDEAIMTFSGATQDARTDGFKKGGFDILAGRSGSATFANLSQMELKGFSLGLEALENVYDKLIVDLGAGVDNTVLTLCGVGGRHQNPNATTLVVLTDEPTSLTDAYALIKMMSMRGYADNLKIVVNMADDVASGKATYQSIQRVCMNFLKIDPPLAGIIRRDSSVKESIRRQAPLLLTHPICDAAKDVNLLASSLTK